MNIIIADDHTLVRNGLKDGLKRAFPDAELYEAESAKGTLKLAKQVAELDVAIVDLFMPDMDGFVFLRRLCNRYRKLPVIVVSATTNPHHIEKALYAGASGFISKSSSEEEFMKAINQVMEGETYVPENPKSLGFDMATPDDSDDPLWTRISAQLTERQLAILRMLGLGMSNRDIAARLEISENTVKVHVSTVLKLLKLSNRAQAGLLAQKFIE